VKEGKKKEVRGAQNKGWVEEWKVFARAIREGEEPPIPYEQLIGVTRATFAAVESIRKEQSISIS
jgi:predicted dehydrogenase